jgi:hypothetical protein
MDNFSKIGIWLNRIVIVAVAFVFLTLGIKNLVHPLENAMKSDIILNSATALSVARVSMGAFPLALAIVLLTSLFSKREIFRGILTVFIFIVVTTIARIASLQIDGYSEFGHKVLIPEIIITILSTIGLYLELRRKNRMSLDEKHQMIS